MASKKEAGRRANKQVHLRFPPDMKRRLRERKEKTGASVAWLIERYVREGLERDAEAAR